MATFLIKRDKTLQVLKIKNHQNSRKKNTKMAWVLCALFVVDECFTFYICSAN